MLEADTPARPGGASLADWFEGARPRTWLERGYRTIFTAAEHGMRHRIGDIQNQRWISP